MLVADNNQTADGIAVPGSVDSVPAEDNLLTVRDLQTYFRLGWHFPAGSRACQGCGRSFFDLNWARPLVW